MTMRIVTGGYGFVGANVCRALLARGDRPVIVEPHPAGPSNELLRGLDVETVPLDVAGAFLDRNVDQIASIVHLGAISDTRCSDADALQALNFDSTVQLWAWAKANRRRFIYASSAATYGDGARGFLDRNDLAYLGSLRPLSPYARSKHRADRRIWSPCESPGRTAGLKFFNIYGPGEHHKKSQASMILQAFDQLASRGSVQLFSFAGQDEPPLRDFVWIDDCVDAILWLCDHPEVVGLFNLGCGTSRSFEVMVQCVADALRREAKVGYFAIPDSQMVHYQRLTICDDARIAAAGFSPARTSLEDGTGRYVRWLIERGQGGS